MIDEPGVRFGIATALLVAVIVAASLAGLQVPETEFVVVIVAGLIGVGLSMVMTAWLGVIAWAMYTGFVENRYGQLTLEAGDLWRLAAFALAALACAVLTRRIVQVIKENAHA